MPKIQPFALVSIIKEMWNAHELNAGRKYAGTSRDLREAKDWLAVNDFDGDLTDIKARLDRFLRDEFEALPTLDWPVWFFLKHYNRYGEKRKAIEKKRPQVKSPGVMIECSSCKHTHGINEPCRIGKAV